MDAERVELIQRLYSQENGCSMGEALDGSCSAVEYTHFDYIANELNKVLPAGTAPITYDEVAHVCEEVEDVCSCDSCGWFSSKSSMENIEGDLICDNCYEERFAEEEEEDD